MVLLESRTSHHSNLVTVRNEVGARLYFHRHLRFCQWGGGHAWLGVWPGGMHDRGQGMHGQGGHVWLGGMHGRGRGHAWWGCVWQGGMRDMHAMSPQADTTAMAYGQWAGSTHPTGMHSCERRGTNQKSLSEWIENPCSSNEATVNSQ